LNRIDDELASARLSEQSAPDDADLARMAHAAPEAREERRVTIAAPLARRAASLALAFEAATIEQNG
jgi:hypothetical protein